MQKGANGGSDFLGELMSDLGGTKMRVATVFLAIAVVWATVAFAEKKTVVKKSATKEAVAEKTEDKPSGFASPESIATDGEFFLCLQCGDRACANGKRWRRIYLKSQP